MALLPFFINKQFLLSPHLLDMFLTSFSNDLLVNKFTSTFSTKIYSPAPHRRYAPSPPKSSTCLFCTIVLNLTEVLLKTNPIFMFELTPLSKLQHPFRNTRAQTSSPKCLGVFLFCKAGFHSKIWISGGAWAA